MRQVPGKTGSPFQKKWIAAALALATLTACTSSGSGLRTVYYTVPGTTAEQINEQIIRRGPQNGHAIGTAETRMTPKVKTVREEGGCKIDSADVALDLIVTLPEFSDLKQADKRTRSAFERLSAHVEWHEQQHVLISQRYAKKIETELAQMPAQKPAARPWTRHASGSSSCLRNTTGLRKLSTNLSARRSNADCAPSA